MKIVYATQEMLVVDDQPLMRTGLRKRLEGIGVRKLAEAANGAEARAHLSNRAFDLVLCDIDMQPVNGMELLQQVRSGLCGPRRDTTFVMLTGVCVREVVKACVELDVNAFLSKPPRRELLAQRLEHALLTSRPLRPAEFYRRLALPPLAGLVPDAPPPALSATPPAAPPGDPKTARESPRAAVVDNVDAGQQLQYLIWSDKWLTGRQALDVVLKQGVELLNRLYRQGELITERGEQDAVLEAVQRFVGEDLCRLAGTHDAGSADDASAQEAGRELLAIRNTLAAVVSRARLYGQVSPEMIQSELFSGMRLWWYDTQRWQRKFHVEEGLRQ